MQIIRQKMDEEFEIVFSEKTYEPLPLVTHLWNKEIYVGGLPNSDTLRELSGLGINHMINYCGGNWPSPPDIKTEFGVVELDTSDQSDYPILSRHFKAFASVVDHIRKKSEAKVFVHCTAGVNCSVCLSAACLMVKFLLDPLEALRIFRENGKGRILQSVDFRHRLIEFFFLLWSFNLK